MILLIFALAAAAVLAVQLMICLHCPRGGRVLPMLLALGMMVLLLLSALADGWTAIALWIFAVFSLLPLAASGLGALLAFFLRRGRQHR